MRLQQCLKHVQISLLFLLLVYLIYLYTKMLEKSLNQFKLSSSFVLFLLLLFLLLDLLQKIGDSFEIAWIGRRIR